MIRLRSKNLVDYGRMRAIASNYDMSYIDNGWLIGRGNNYGKKIVKLSMYTFLQNETYYIVADVECVYAGEIRNFSALQLSDYTNSIRGSLIVGKQLHTMSVGEQQRVVYKCTLPKDAVNNKNNGIVVYNSYNPNNPDKTGDSFKITNLCLFKEDYTIDYVPYWYEPSKIMVRTKNLFVPSYNSSVTKEDNGFVCSGWGLPFNTHEIYTKMFKPNKTYTLSFDLEFVETPPYSYATSALGFNFYDSESKTVLALFTTYVQPSQIVVGNKIHMSFKRTMPADLKEAVLLSYSGYCRNADENNKWYYVTTRFSNIMLTEGDTEIDYVPYMSEVKTVAWGVKDECKLVLNGSEKWVDYTPGSLYVGCAYYKMNNTDNIRESHYSNYFGFSTYNNSSNPIWLTHYAVCLAWIKGSPPFPSWETTDADGKAIANIPQIKADLAKRNLVVYYDNTNSRPKTLAQLLKIVRREVYNQFIAVVNGNTLEVSGKMSDGVLELDSDKVSVSDSTLQLGGGNSSSQASVEDGTLIVSGDVDNGVLALAGTIDGNNLIL